ncbi:hypothetical protein [Cryptosporangium sp. NPDC051539]|uniref:hypothetical protein n=1 Tax=Cryptosporangium sp. NPDC051539 TaxID=3363962 RepID=UPI00379976E7
MTARRAGPRLRRRAASGQMFANAAISVRPSRGPRPRVGVENEEPAGSTIATTPAYQASAGFVRSRASAVSRFLSGFVAVARLQGVRAGPDG